MINIAICEDDYLQLELLKTCIQRFPFRDQVNLIETSSSSEFIKKMNDSVIDIALLDIGIDEINGIELGKLVRKKFPDCIVVFITGMKDYALEAFEINAFRYLLKPFGQLVFFECMENALVRWEEMKNYKEYNQIMTFYEKDKLVKLSI